MSDPQRLLDDPDAPAELRHALAAEVQRGAGYDAAALGARIAAGVAAGAPLGAGPLGAGAHGISAWFGPKALIATALVSATLGAGGHALYVAARAAAATPPAPVAAIEPAVPPDVVVAPAPAPVPAPVAAPVARPAPVSSAVDAGPRAAPARGALAEELRLYERGEAALHEGHLDVAVRELERYLAEHPRGTLRAEAELALVQALSRSGRCDDAARVARRAAPSAHRDALRTAARECRTTAR